jgi:hypothetical protein
MFGCISHVITQVAWGRFARSFMPDFSDFSYWDDLVVPIFLGLGIVIVSFGPIIILSVVLLAGVIHSDAASHLNAADGPLPAAQSSGATDNDPGALLDPTADSKKLEEAFQKPEQLQPGAEIGKQVEKSQNKQNEPTAMVRLFKPYFGAGIVFLLLFLLGMAWAVFYLPMALTVAGYTQSFWSVVNPLLGLDTIRRMGSTYFKAFVMVLVVEAVALMVSALIGFITSPFALPLIGNLPAYFINGSLTFYSNLVIACLLGLSLYKCADRLGIAVE